MKLSDGVDAGGAEQNAHAHLDGITGKPSGSDIRCTNAGGNARLRFPEGEHLKSKGRLELRDEANVRLW